MSYQDQQTGQNIFQNVQKQLSQLNNKYQPNTLQNKQEVQQVIQNKEPKINQTANYNIIQQSEFSISSSKISFTQPLIQQMYFLKKQDNLINMQKVSKELNSTSEIQIIKKNNQKINLINQSNIQRQQQNNYNQNVFCIICKQKDNSNCQALLVDLQKISYQYKGHYCLQCICNCFQSYQQRLNMYIKALQLNLFYCYKCGNQFFDKTIKDKIFKCLEKSILEEKIQCQKCNFYNLIKVYI
ncbi:hypothetical protein TTHERM_000007546 (macronuclear) [Tetrahymena thermophila SB210]|uniref:Uncharacterized protein n=1 Tax=Tetrahymena thermophila (strain SB210) TaxID=312017 RepID=W7XAB1_TETTS|nr:hypothetical protein TTHERM_000007546 [Tetrahymena thermophila SB210]EWS76310.1 hypothetical protein TTHERM_000007546 [Tetrahymena thermophila SB210]|eukprot:XP_012651094.1 hypothetical protein TTHERM_000007546 [Tetrahymena thermophila SB210]